jgi:hypothetical protein
MSELTPCNFCSLQWITSQAERDGATVTVRPVPPEGRMEGWQAAWRSDRDQPVAYFQALTTHCVC